MKMSVNKLKIRIIFVEILSLIILLCIDQLGKYFAQLYLKGNTMFSVISGVLSLTYLENTGSAFGLLNGQRVLFIFIACIISGVIILILFRMPIEKHYFGLRFPMILILSGILGNMTDRILHFGVIDFIYIEVIRFPVFNFADTYITISTLTLIIVLLFVYKEKDFGFIYLKSNKYREIK